MEENDKDNNESASENENEQETSKRSCRKIYIKNTANVIHTFRSNK